LFLLSKYGLFNGKLVVAFSKYRGIFKPKNPGKYVGDLSSCTFRSLLELRMMTYIDRHPDIIKWSSETIVVPYISPKDGRQHRYFVDLAIVKRTPDGKEHKLLVEIKPDFETKPPKPPKTKKGTRRFLEESITWSVNSAKWRAAREFAAAHGCQFLVITDLDINGKSGK